MPRLPQQLVRLCFFQADKSHAALVTAPAMQWGKNIETSSLLRLAPAGTNGQSTLTISFRNASIRFRTDNGFAVTSGTRGGQHTTHSRRIRVAGAQKVR